jgi:hypothetical protein
MAAKKQSQITQILKRLRKSSTKNPLTPGEALEKFHCMRLGARIHEIRTKGLLLDSEALCSELRHLPDGTRVSHYWIEPNL